MTVLVITAMARRSNCQNYQDKRPDSASDLPCTVTNNAAQSTATPLAGTAFKTLCGEIANTVKNYSIHDRYLRVVSCQSR